MTALIFDLDGTLIDSAPEIAGLLNSVMQDEGQEPFTLAQVTGFIGNGAQTLVARAMAARGMDMTQHGRILDVLLKRYQNAPELTILYPGVRAALEGWHAAGVAMGICTNKPIAATEKVLSYLNLTHLFDVVIGGDSLETRKPDPLMLTHAIATMGVTDVVYVGDSEVDAATAQAAAVPFALFTQGYRKTSVANIPHEQSFDDWHRFYRGLAL